MNSIEKAELIIEMTDAEEEITSALLSVIMPV